MLLMPAAPILADPAPVAIAAPRALATLAPTAPVLAAASSDLDGEALCMAKVVHREAGSEPRKGQLAVAQTLLNRIRSGRFAKTICGVANQRGQYFNTSRYNPRRDTPIWKAAVAVTQQALDERTPEVVPGAMYFRAVYASNSGLRNRTPAGKVGLHIFYR
jgi:spore germination cell wall hydrolase CwlJ-like protein